MSDQANLLRSYNAVLHGARHRWELQALGEDFWFKHGDRPAVADILYQAHVNRVAGRSSPAACDEALRSATKEITT